MGFGAGKGFTKLKTTWAGSGVVTTPGGMWRFMLVSGKLISTVTAVASGTSSSKSTSGKLTTTKSMEVT